MTGLTYKIFKKISVAKPSCSISELSRDYLSEVPHMKKLMPIIASLVALVLAAGASFTWA